MRMVSPELCRCAVSRVLSATTRCAMVGSVVLSWGLLPMTLPAHAGRPVGLWSNVDVLCPGDTRCGSIAGRAPWSQSRSLPLFRRPERSKDVADMSLDGAKVHIQEIRGDLRLAGLVVFRTCLFVGAICRIEIFTLFRPRSALTRSTHDQIPYIVNRI